jgi:hypothetical protein
MILEQTHLGWNVKLQESNSGFVDDRHVVFQSLDVTDKVVVLFYERLLSLFHPDNRQSV